MVYGVCDDINFEQFVARLTYLEFRYIFVSKYLVVSMAILFLGHLFKSFSNQMRTQTERIQHQKNPGKNVSRLILQWADPGVHRTLDSIQLRLSDYLRILFSFWDDIS